MMNLEHNDRVVDTKGAAGKFLRYERYPDGKIYATVKWDWAMFPRRADPKSLRRDA